MSTGNPHYLPDYNQYYRDTYEEPYYIPESWRHSANSKILPIFKGLRYIEPVAHGALGALIIGKTGLDIFYKKQREEMLRKHKIEQELLEDEERKKQLEEIQTKRELKRAEDERQSQLILTRPDQNVKSRRDVEVRGRIHTEMNEPPLIRVQTLTSNNPVNIPKYKFDIPDRITVRSSDIYKYLDADSEAAASLINRYGWEYASHSEDFLNLNPRLIKLFNPEKLRKAVISGRYIPTGLRQYIAPSTMNKIARVAVPAESSKLIIRPPNPQIASRSSFREFAGPTINMPLTEYITSPITGKQIDVPIIDVKVPSARTIYKRGKDSPYEHIRESAKKALDLIYKHGFSKSIREHSEAFPTRLKKLFDRDILIDKILKGRRIPDEVMKFVPEESRKLLDSMVKPVPKKQVGLTQVERDKLNELNYIKLQPGANKIKVLYETRGKLGKGIIKLLM